MANYEIVHIEFAAKNIEESASFYRDLFGWKIEHYPEMQYATFDPGIPPGGGFNPIGEETPPGSVMVYIGSEDIDADLARIEARGGKIIAMKREIPGTGWFGIFEDPGGTQVALFTPLMP